MDDVTVSKAKAPVLSKTLQFMDCVQRKKPSVSTGGFSMMDVLAEAEQNLHTYSLKFSSCSTLFATGSGDAAVRLYSVKTGKQLACLVDPMEKKVVLPATAIAFHPTSKNKMLLVGGADGSITQWGCDSQTILDHIDSQGVQKKTDELDDEGEADGPGPPIVQITKEKYTPTDKLLPAVYAVNYRKDGNLFVTGDAASCVRVFDGTTKQCLKTWKFTPTPGGVAETHSSSVYAAKFARKDNNIIVTGGWDRTVKVWDIRMNESVKSIYGPIIVGDSVDCNDRKEIVTGSNSLTNQLQVWDMGTGGLMYNLPWNGIHSSATETPLIYSVAWSEDGKKIVAGGKSPNQAALFVRPTKKQSEHLSSEKEAGTWVCQGHGDHPGAIYAVAIAPNSRLFAFAGASSTIHLYKFE